MKKIVAIDGTHPVIRLMDRSVALQPRKSDQDDARPHAVVDEATAWALMNHEPGRILVEDLAGMSAPVKRSRKQAE